MFGFFAKRLLQTIPTLIGVSLVCFFMIHLIPGDPAQLIAGNEASADEVSIVRERLGLDKPLYVQYGSYLVHILQGDLGTSLRSERPVATEILARFPNTLTLTLFSIAIMVVVGLFAGMSSATKPNSARDHVSMLFSLLGISVPVFWFGILLILLFSYQLHLLPSGGTAGLESFILPSLVLGLSSSAVLARLTRSSVLEVVNQDYIRTARAKGVRESAVYYLHALKNASIPIITIIGLEFGNLLGGAVLTETVFSMNGLGRYVVQAIQFRDYPAVQGSVLFIALIFVLVNMAVDLCYAALDPRIRLGTRGV